MDIRYYPDEKRIREAMQVDDPLLMLVSFNGKELLLSHIDDAVEHVILLRKLNYKETEIDRFFRVVLTQDGADWTFVCPSDYKGISNKDKRVETFFNDGINLISKAIKAIGYNVEINIPARYRRHFNMLCE